MAVNSKPLARVRHKNVSWPSLLFRLPGIIRTQELLDHETTPHYWLTVYAMDRGVVPLSAFVEVYIEVQDVNDNAPQTSEPVYYPSVMENSPKDVSIIQINAFDPDTKASDRLSYRITSGNPQGFFAINARTGKTSASQMEACSTSSSEDSWHGLILMVNVIAGWHLIQHQYRITSICGLDIWYKIFISIETGGGCTEHVTWLMWMMLGEGVSCPTWLEGNWMSCSSFQCKGTKSANTIF